MFAIYNNGNVDFKSTTDDLYALKNIEKVQASHLRAEDGYFESLIKQQNNGNSESNKEALNSYKKMANIDTSEIVFHVKDIMTKDCIYIDEKSPTLNSRKTLYAS